MLDHWDFGPSADLAEQKPMLATIGRPKPLLGYGSKDLGLRVPGHRPKRSRGRYSYW